jgi:hypothetical protein
MQFKLVSLNMRSIALSVGLCLVFLVSNAQAARVSKVKGDQVLIDGVDDGSMSVGDKYFVMIDGKKKGLIEITKAKGSKAIAKIIKGKAEADAEIAPAVAAAPKKVAKSGSKRKKSKKKKSEDGEGSPVDGLFWGGLVGLGVDSQSVTIQNPTTLTSQTVAMSGLGYSLRVFGDLPFTDQLGAIARVGIEQMNLSGASGASTSIMYLSGDILARYDIIKGSFVPYVAGGLSISMPVAQSSTVLGTIASVMTFLADGGVRYYLDDDMYIIGLAEYMYFPASSNVTTSIIAVRGGLGLRF